MLGFAIDFSGLATDSCVWVAIWNISFAVQWYIVVRIIFGAWKSWRRRNESEKNGAGGDLD